MRQVTNDTTHIGIQDELKTARDRDKFSDACRFESKEKNLFLNTYSVKAKSKENKNVLLLSTACSMKKKTKDERRRSPQYTNSTILRKVVQI